MEVDYNLQDATKNNVYKNNYEKNIAIFKKYEWCNIKVFSSFEKLNKIIVENTDEEYAIFDRISNNVSVSKKDNITMVEQLYTESFLLCNLNNFANIASLAKSIKYFVSAYFFGERKARYVYYDDLEKFLLMLQTDVDIEALAEGSLIFFVGKDALLGYDYLGINSSEQIIGNSFDNLAKEILLKDIADSDKQRWQEYEQIISENNRWYQENNESVQERIRNKNPRIMFLSTKTRAFSWDKFIAKIFADCGLEVKVQIESTPFYKLFMMCRISQMQMLRDIHKFKPDIIFTVLGERTQLIIPSEIYWLVLILDDLARFKNKKWIERLTSKDYFLEGICREIPLEKWGYKKGRVINIDEIEVWPLDIYKKDNLSLAEKEKYGVEIVFVANTMPLGELKIRAKKLISDWLDVKWWVEAEKVVEAVYDKTREGILFKRKHVEKYVNLFCKKILMEEHKLEKFTLEWKYFLEYVAYQAFRHKIADWCVDAGYTNLKLYGKGWAEIEKFKHYSCINTYDETPKIYQSAKININPSIWTPIACRTVEAFMCGGFILNYAPDNDDRLNAPSVLDNEPIFFRDKKDLLKKIDYYLLNIQERQKIVEQCRNKILERNNSNYFSKKILSQMADTIDVF